jgi:hypothetical protein
MKVVAFALHFAAVCGYSATRFPVLRKGGVALFSHAFRPPVGLRTYPFSFADAKCLDGKNLHRQMHHTILLLNADESAIPDTRPLVSPEELIPGSDQMKARAQKTMLRMGKQLLTPLEVANVLAGDTNELLAPQGSLTDDDDVLFIDVRTPQQRADHEILPGGVKVHSSLNDHSHTPSHPTH